MKYFETGFDATILTELVKKAKLGDQITTIGLNAVKMEETKKLIHDLPGPYTAYVVFRLQDPIIALSKVTWADAVYLNSDLSLQETVEEFRAAATTGASIISINSYQHKAAFAVIEAIKSGWKASFVGDRAILTR